MSTPTSGNSICAMTGCSRIGRLFLGPRQRLRVCDLYYAISTKKAPKGSPSPEVKLATLKAEAKTRKEAVQAKRYVRDFAEISGLTAEVMGFRTYRRQLRFTLKFENNKESEVKMDDVKQAVQKYGALMSKFNASTLLDDMAVKIAAVTAGITAEEVTEHATQYGQVTIKSLFYHTGAVTKASAPSPTRYVYRLDLGTRARLYFSFMHYKSAAEARGPVEVEAQSLVGPGVEEEERGPVESVGPVEHGGAAAEAQGLVGPGVEEEEEERGPVESVEPQSSSEGGSAVADTPRPPQRAESASEAEAAGSHPKMAAANLAGFATAKPEPSEGGSAVAVPPPQRGENTIKVETGAKRPETCQVGGSTVKGGEEKQPRT